MLYFLFLFKDIPPLTYLAFIVAYLLVVMVSITLHEFAHAFVAHRFGDATPKAQGRLSINPLAHLDMFGVISFLLIGFGWAKPVEINPLKFRNYKLGMSLVSVAGVATNLVLAFAFSAFLFFVPGLLESSNLFLNFLYFFFYFGFYINIGLFVFNLLPIYPLDGFNFIRTFLPYRSKFVNFMFKYGSFILLIFIITPLFDIVYGYATGGIIKLFNLFWGLF